MIAVRGVTRNTQKIPKNRLFWVLFRFLRHFLVTYDHILGHLPTPSGWKPIGVPFNTVSHQFTMVTVHFYRRTTSNTLFWEYFEMKSVFRKRVCKTSFSWDKGCLIYFFEGKGILWSPVLGRTRYTPLCPPKTRILIHFFKILVCFWKLFQKNTTFLVNLEIWL